MIVSVGLFVAAALAGGMGALVRDAAATWVAGRKRSTAWAIAAVNVVGSAIAGAIAGLVAAGAADPALAFVVAGGFAGGLTTFSTWMVDSVQFVHTRQFALAALNILASLALGVAAAAAAAWLTFALATLAT